VTECLYVTVKFLLPRGAQGLCVFFAADCPDCLVPPGNRAGWQNNISRQTRR